MKGQPARRLRASWSARSVLPGGRGWKDRRRRGECWRRAQSTVRRSLCLLQQLFDVIKIDAWTSMEGLRPDLERRGCHAGRMGAHEKAEGFVHRLFEGAPGAVGSLLNLG